MCGIVGVAGDITYREEQIYKTLLILNQLRGHHSTGTLFVQKKPHGKKDKAPHITMCKELGAPHEKFFNSSVYKAQMNKKNCVLIGHGRHATSGSSDSVEGAHPFRWRNTTTNNSYGGVHNGTLRSRNNLTDPEKFEVDSDNIYYDMAARDNSIETLEKLNGAFALVWYESATEKLHMARNHERPLFYRYNERGDVVFWASEPWMIDVAASRLKSNYPLNKKVHTVEVNKRYTFDIPLDTFIKKVELPETEGYTPFTRTTGGGGRWVHGKWVENSSSTITYAHNGRKQTYSSGEEYWDEVYSRVSEEDKRKEEAKLRTERIKVNNQALKNNRRHVPITHPRTIEGNISKPNIGHNSEKKDDSTVINLPPLGSRNRRRVQEGWNHSQNRQFKGRWQNWGCGTASFQLWDEKKGDYVTKKTEKGNEVTKVVYSSNHVAVPMLKSEFVKHVKHGCSVCTTTLQWGDTVCFHEIAGELAPLCENCENDAAQLQRCNFEPRKLYGNYTDIVNPN